MKQSYFDERYLLTYDLADENTKDTTVLNVIDKETDVNYIFYY